MNTKGEERKQMSKEKGHGERKGGSWRERHTGAGREGKGGRTGSEEKALCSLTRSQVMSGSKSPVAPSSQPHKDV